MENRARGVPDEEVIDAEGEDHRHQGEEKGVDGLDQQLLGEIGLGRRFGTDHPEIEIEDKEQDGLRRLGRTEDEHQDGTGKGANDGDDANIA